MKCLQCGEEFEAKRKTAKYCSDKCRKLAFLEEGVSVPKEKPVETVSVLGDSVPEVSVLNKCDDELSVTNPLKRITKVPKFFEGYYESETYKNLIEELEQKPIKQLEDEGYFIPAWKYTGYRKKPSMKGLLKEARCTE